MASSRFFIVCLLSAVSFHQTCANVNVNTSLGAIDGETTNINGTTVYRFLGIPYAKPPVGSLRFRKPEPYGKWSGTLNATQFGSPCPQMEGIAIGEEDCLTLNIFQPNGSKSEHKSVMIWIHGGGFMTGSSNQFLADILAAEGDVIVVTINYRLNVFGFLSTGDATIPGNMGLWDQQLAIKWVKENIGDYGGNSSSITLFGESAGGRSISFQMFSPQNNNTLFQRAITESGSALSLTYINRHPQTIASKVAATLSCPSSGSALLSCLRQKTKLELLSAMSKVDRPFPFFPAIDNDFLTVDLGYMMRDYNKGSANVAQKIGNFAQYDFLGGFNSQEGLVYVQRINKISKDMDHKNVSQGVSEAVYDAALNQYPFYNFVDNANTKKLLVNMAKVFYETNSRPSVSSGRSMDDKRLEWYTRLAGDVALVVPTIETLILHTSLSEKPTYCYEFDHKRNSATYWYEGPEWLRTGADHADEIPYVFGQPLGHGIQKYAGKNITFTDDEVNLSKALVYHWSNFAKNGNPGNYSSSRQWMPFTVDNQACAHILIRKTVVQEFPREASVRFYRSLQTTADDSSKLHFNCTNAKGHFLSGSLYLTMKGADRVLTTLFVVTVLAGLAILILLPLYFVSQYKINKLKKKNKNTE